MIRVWADEASWDFTRRFQKHSAIPGTFAAGADMRQRGWVVGERAKERCGRKRDAGEREMRAKERCGAASRESRLFNPVQREPPSTVLVGRIGIFGEKKFRIDFN